MSEEKKITVMIVDDDNLLLDMYSMKFETKGYEVVKITSSGECLNQLREGLKPDVLMMDMVMPQMSGIDLLKTIREEKLSPGTKIFVLSNQNQNSEVEEAEKYDIEGYIVKAESTPSVVLEKIEKIIK